MAGLQVGAKVDREIGEAREGGIVHRTGEPSWCEDASVPRYRNVLVAFDGSPEAELALAHAIGMAQVLPAPGSGSSPS